ncbi:TetR/AcrR family transcriptional regulator [Edaphobacter sp. HDX4]|uniref:TetR/AcrR family transcriptional regulator n=1 Tax=Edaphobacter sp. HDX4 TaxID=2794064 RepID=UPI002FE65D2C
MGYGGRPRKFERDGALETAMLLFWEHGFEQTGIDDLAKAMRISTSSLYSTFGDKRQLFLEALDLYRSGRGGYTKTTLEVGGSALDSFRRLFETAARELTRGDQPRGCMLTLSLPTFSQGLEELQVEVSRRRAESLDGFRKRLARAKREKDLPPFVDVNLLASFLMTTLMGMSLQARSGASRSHLLKIGELALQAWPGARP